MSSFPSGDIQFVSKVGDRYLFNHRDEKLVRVQFADLLISSNEGGVPFVFPAPVYEVKHIPPHAYIELPARDQQLDGYMLLRIDEAEWDDGQTVTDPLKLSERSLWGGAVFSEEKADRELKQLRTEPERRAKTTDD